MLPDEPQLGSKGAVLALADGISSSRVSAEASASAVKSFIDGYYATPESWSVGTSARRVLQATNSWLYAQTCNAMGRFNLEKGYICTLSAMVIKSNTAYLFHIGDSRIYRLSGAGLEQLTEDHRLWESEQKSYLSHALGMREKLHLDHTAMPVQVGDCFILATDGVYEFCSDTEIAEIIAGHCDDLELAAHLIVQKAMANASNDNLTIQIVRIEQLPNTKLPELQRQAADLAFPPEMHPGTEFEGYRIERALHHSSRSHIYLASDKDTGESVILKTPSVDLWQNAEYRERFLMEDWVARRVNNAHLLKSIPPRQQRQFLYNVSEYIQGQTLVQWMIDNPRPSLETVRNIVVQIARGLNALHRQEMLHQDLRPANVMICDNGTVKIIDFGSVHVAGVEESTDDPQPMLGTVQYCAPEYFLGESGSIASDLFSLAVITYQMLCGKLPYGAQIARATTRGAQLRLVYRSLLEDDPKIPVWIDETLRKALHPNPVRRYDTLSEFVYDLRVPNPAFANKQHKPLVKRNPLLFWKGLSLLLFLTIVAMLLKQYWPIAGH
ncbi:MAG: bifunctional protein-serine/threonine kinase/phosphatase [Gammaproteobacteria bacterium]|nr:bifunctional protein-serine/threonine kinase/phosphatase [Gammaproteobacteria bacterium]